MSGEGKGGAHTPYYPALCTNSFPDHICLILNNPLARIAVFLLHIKLRGIREIQYSLHHLDIMVNRFVRGVW